MYDTLIVPIDLSQVTQGKAMIEIARQLANKNAKIILINVIDEIPAYIAAELPSDLLEKSAANAHSALKDIAKTAGLSSPVEVRRGQISTSIIACAEEHDADIIIIASHRPGFQDYLLGSTAARVVRHSKISVLVVR